MTKRRLTLKLDFLYLISTHFFCSSYFLNFKFVSGTIFQQTCHYKPGSEAKLRGRFDNSVKIAVFPL